MFPKTNQIMALPCSEIPVVNNKIQEPIGSHLFPCHIECARASSAPEPCPGPNTCPFTLHLANTSSASGSQASGSHHSICVQKAMAPHSSALAWKIPWTEEPGRLQSMGSRRVGHDFTFTFHFHALEKEMATHSSVLAWRIPGTGEPGGLPSPGSHRVGHN